MIDPLQQCPYATTQSLHQKKDGGGGFVGDRVEGGICLLPEPSAAHRGGCWRHNLVSIKDATMNVDRLWTTLRIRTSNIYSTTFDLRMSEDVSEQVCKSSKQGSYRQ
jgi:hypothetical protein